MAKAKKEWCKYAFKGSVMDYKTLVASNYTAETWARSIEEARNNIAHVYKRKHNMTTQGHCIRLIGDPVVVQRGGSRA